MSVRQGSAIGLLGVVTLVVLLVVIAFVTRSPPLRNTEPEPPMTKPELHYYATASTIVGEASKITATLAGSLLLYGDEPQWVTTADVTQCQRRHDRLVQLAARATALTPPARFAHEHDTLLNVLGNAADGTCDPRSAGTNYNLYSLVSEDLEGVHERLWTISRTVA